MMYDFGPVEKYCLVYCGDRCNCQRGKMTLKTEDIMSPSCEIKMWPIETPISFTVNAEELARYQSPLNTFCRDIHDSNRTWWYDHMTGKKLDRNKGEMLMLIVSEVAEAMEGERKDLMDDHLPHRKMSEVELADALIRIFDYAGAYNMDLDGAVREKREYNLHRADHKIENRLKPGGKKF